MTRIFYILFIALLLSGCVDQNRYFEPEGIIDKTQEYVKENKGWTILEDKIRVDGYTRIGDSIFGGEIACNVDPLENIDIDTFEVLPGTKYARDKNHVYYPLVIPCIDYTDCGVCFYEQVIVKDADPKTFRYLKKEYAVDRQNVYFRGEKIEKADPMTFRVIDGPEYFYFAADSNHVYRHNQIFKEADPATFHYDKEDERNTTGLLPDIIIRDKEHEWQYTPPSTIKEIEKK